jgi:sulfatase maturation enzyme AslB (radical SAM superfamily)
VIREGECADCRFWELCHGGCPLDAYSQHKSFMHKSEWCASRKLFISKYLEPITGVRFEPARRKTRAA